MLWEGGAAAEAAVGSIVVASVALRGALHPEYATKLQAQGSDESELLSAFPDLHPTCRAPWVDPRVVSM